jgi:hypothetical protein
VQAGKAPSRGLEAPHASGKSAVVQLGQPNASMRSLCRRPSLTDMGHGQDGHPLNGAGTAHSLIEQKISGSVRQGAMPTAALAASRLAAAS